MKPKPPTEKAYMRAVDDLLQSRFGITINDVDQESVEGCRHDGWTPIECAEWLEQKFDLDRIDLGPYGGTNA